MTDAADMDAFMAESMELEDTTKTVKDAACREDR